MFDVAVEIDCLGSKCLPVLYELSAYLEGAAGDGLIGGKGGAQVVVLFFASDAAILQFSSASFFLTVSTFLMSPKRELTTWSLSKLGFVLGDT